MTDDLETVVNETDGVTLPDDPTEDATADRQEPSAGADAAVAEAHVETDIASVTKEGDAADGADEPPVMPDGTADDPAPARKRTIAHLLGTLLIIAGIAIIGLTVGITAWRQQQQQAETRAFLARVSTPSASPNLLATTPFPSTVSGASVPDTALTPTANVATRQAQPVATTASGVDRSLIAAVPVPAATPTAAAATDVPSPTPKPRMPKPTHIDIPAIKVDSDIVEVGVSPTVVDGQQAYIWDVAPYAVGHHFSSADPGEGENVVLSGHDDWQGEVFKNLYKLKKGDEIDLKAGDRDIKYHVEEILLLPEVGQPLEKRMENAKFIGTTGDERLTLVTCWPYAVDDHRLIVIARPDAA